MQKVLKQKIVLQRLLFVKRSSCEVEKGVLKCAIIFVEGKFEIHTGTAGERR